MSAPNESLARAPSGHRPRRLALWELLVLIAGVALGLWLFTKELQDPADDTRWLIALVAVLGGCSLVGPPLLLWERRRSKAVWRAGRVHWFAQGTAAWLMWPPMVAARLRGNSVMNNSGTGLCYFYGTPLMALYVTLALLAGGWIRPRRGRRRRRHSWREPFGLLLGLAWACTGLYLLANLYREDFK
jgi:hypothetical protein